MPDPATLTERQQKWFAAVRAGLERDTGRSLDDWAKLARACPESRHRARLAWMKATHGLGQNHASMVLNAAFPADATWVQGSKLADALWNNPEQAALFALLRDRIMAMDGVIMGQRKAFTAFSRKVQFAAARPLRSGGLVLGLALEPAGDPRLSAAGRNGWSERLHSEIRITAPEAIDDHLMNLMTLAHDRS
jgi:predicted transport protein